MHWHPSSIPRRSWHASAVILRLHRTALHLTPAPCGTQEVALQLPRSNSNQRARVRVRTVANGASLGQLLVDSYQRALETARRGDACR